MIMGYLTFYLTDSIFLSAGTVAAILAVSRVFDGISDVFAGYIIDHTKTRWGKARPYTIFTAVMWIAVILLFSVPDLSVTGKIIYVFLIYNLTETIARTMTTAAFTVHFKLAFTNDEQVQLTGFSGFIGGILSLGVGVLLPILVAQYGTTPEGWRLIAIVIAVPSMVLGLLKLFFVPEVDEEAIYRSKKERASFKESIKLLFKNKYIFMLLAAMLLTNLPPALGVAAYYFKYIVGDIAAQSVISMLGILSMAIMPFLPALARKVGIRKTIFLTLMIGFVGVLAPLLSPANVLLIAIGMAINTVAAVPVSMYSNLIVISCMKYTEWKDGKQIDGIISSVGAVAQKVGRALGALVTGVALGIVGYDGTLAVQSDAANSMIIFLYIGVPAIMSLIAALIMRKYTLEEKMPQIEQEIAERKKAGAGA